MYITLTKSFTFFVLYHNLSFHVIFSYHQECSSCHLPQLSHQTHNLRSGGRPAGSQSSIQALECIHLIGQIQKRLCDETKLHLYFAYYYQMSVTRSVEIEKLREIVFRQFDGIFRKTEMETLSHLQVTWHTQVIDHYLKMSGP